jgi:Fic family protein
LYIHERKGWPSFDWDQATLMDSLATTRHHQGRLIGRMEGLGFQLRQEASFGTLTQDILKSSEIEGEVLDASQVRSSLARRLGIDIGALTPSDRHVDGVVEMMLDATGKNFEPLTNDRLFGWHTSLFPAGRSGMQKIRVGTWRDDSSGPMQVVSGAVGREKVHFQAPQADRLPDEMARFTEWFNAKETIDPVLKAALAHFWFVTIHPFDDGNGRIARAIADLSLARSEKTSMRFYSMSAQIRVERAEYYRSLEKTQKGTLNITLWMKWFVACLGRAIEGAEKTLEVVLRKARFRETTSQEPFNERQRKILEKLLEGFDGNLTTTKWAKITKCSQDTASRDINDLLRRGILHKGESGGRSTHYLLTER